MKRKTGGIFMESLDIDKIEQIRRDRKNAHDFLSEKSKAYGAFTQLAKEAFSEGMLNKKTKELMAVGISIVIHCEPCLVWHIGEALKAGARDQEVIESMEVAMEMGGGPATVSTRFALKVLEYFRAKEKGKTL
jgi:AhpD family alkylhydroperoxidase